MVLLITNSKNAADCLSAMESDLSEPVEAVSTLRQGSAKLRSSEYSAIVVDQSLVDMNPAASDPLWKHAGTATLVFVNFAISSADRIARAVRAALKRRQQEQLLAGRAAQTALRNELTGPISGILLSSELALAQPAIPSSVADKLRSVHELALEIKSRLGSVA